MASNHRYPEDPRHDGNAHKGTNKRPPCNKNIARLLVRLEPKAQKMRYETRQNVYSIARNKTVQISIDIKVEIRSL